MVEKKEVLLTEEGLAKIKSELEELKTEKRQQVAVRLKEAIAQGDLSENSEYDSAKEEQAFIESRSHSFTYTSSLILDSNFSAFSSVDEIPVNK